jgi:hypothetical protein
MVAMAPSAIVVIMRLGLVILGEGGRRESMDRRTTRRVASLALVWPLGFAGLDQDRTLAHQRFIDFCPRNPLVVATEFLLTTSVPGHEDARHTLSSRGQRPGLPKTLFEMLLQDASLCLQGLPMSGQRLGGLRLSRSSAGWRFFQRPLRQCVPNPRRLYRRPGVAVLLQRGHCVVDGQLARVLRIRPRGWKTPRHGPTDVGKVYQRWRIIVRQGVAGSVNTSSVGLKDRGSTHALIAGRLVSRSIQPNGVTMVISRRFVGAPESLRRAWDPWGLTGWTPTPLVFKFKSSTATPGDVSITTCTSGRTCWTQTSNGPSIGHHHWFPSHRSTGL